MDDEAAQPEATGVTGPQRHTAPELANQLKTVTKGWNIDLKIVAVVHDNASNVKNIAEAVDTADIPCTAHTVQLCVKKGLNSSNHLKTLIGAANRLVAHFKRSTLAMGALEAAQKSHAPGKPVNRLITSCVTRWNSTYEMMHRIVELRWPICDVLSNPEFTSLSDAKSLELRSEQWNLMSELIKCLKPLQVTMYFNYD